MDTVVEACESTNRNLRFNLVETFESNWHMRPSSKLDLRYRFVDIFLHLSSFNNSPTLDKTAPTKPNSFLFKREVILSEFGLMHFATLDVDFVTLGLDFATLDLDFATLDLVTLDVDLDHLTIILPLEYFE